MIDGFLVDLFRMTVPPTHSAGIRAEFHSLFAGLLSQLLAAAKAAIGIGTVIIMRSCLCAGEGITAAVGRDLIFGKAKSIGNGGIAIARLTELLDFLFLFLCHIESPPLSNGDEWPRLTKKNKKRPASLLKRDSQAMK